MAHGAHQDAVPDPNQWGQHCDGLLRNPVREAVGSDCHYNLLAAQLRAPEEPRRGCGVRLPLPHRRSGNQGSDEQ